MSYFGSGTDSENSPIMVTLFVASEPTDVTDGSLKGLLIVKPYLKGMIQLNYRCRQALLLSG